MTKRARRNTLRGIPHSQFAISDMRYPSGMNSKGPLKANEDLSIAHPKQSYNAYQYLTSLFDGTVRAAPEVAVELKMKEKGSAYAFRDQTSGGPAITFWHSGAVPTEAVVTQMSALGLRGDAMKEPLLVDIRVGAVYGIPESAIESGAGRVVMSLPIYDSPLLVCEKAFLEGRRILLE